MLALFASVREQLVDRLVAWLQANPGRRAGDELEDRRDVAPIDDFQSRISGAGMPMYW